MNTAGITREQAADMAREIRALLYCTPNLTPEAVRQFQIALDSIERAFPGI
jgi:hypothetical protein